MELVKKQAKPMMQNEVIIEKYLTLQAENEKLKQEILSLSKKYDALLQDHYTDPLTTVLNRNWYRDCFANFLKSNMGSKKHIAVLMFDIDNFKMINDTYGHLVGDKILKGVASFFKKNVKKDDVVVRYGGEEFLVALRDVDTKLATQIANRIRKEIKKWRYEIDDQRSINVSISGGIAVTDTFGIDAEKLVNKADNALYEAKSLGRNRIWVGYK